MDQRPLISVITVDFNGLDLTKALLDSLRKVSSCNLEIIVVDNGSDANEAEQIGLLYPEVRTVRSEINLGFAGGNNLGIKEATGDYVFFLNNDTELLEDNLAALCREFEDNPSLGIVCPKIRFYQGRRPIQFAGYAPMSRITIRNSLVGFMAEDDGSYDSPALTPFAHGAAMLVRRRALEDVGPMPECYFLYYEELDWSEMFTRKGWQILYSPLQTVFHKESATIGQQSPTRAFHMARNRQLFAWRNRSGLERAAAIAYVRYVACSKEIVQSLVHGRKDLAAATVKGSHAYRKMTREEKLC